MSFGARFLRRPEPFPEAGEGEPWGGRELALDLPGGPYRVAGLSPAQEEGVRATFPGSLGAGAVPEVGLGAGVAATEGGSATPGKTTAAGAGLAAPGKTAAAGGGPAAPGKMAVPGAGSAAPGEAPLAATGIEVRVFRRAALDFLPVDARGWEYGLDCDWSPAAVRLAGLGLAARVDWRRGGLAGALWTCEDGGPRFPGVFENFLRVLVAYRLLELGGVVLHSAGVVRGGAAFLFLGRSGAGKTTVARLGLARGAEVLSDDLNALVPRAGGGCAVLKLPFTGDLGERRAAVPPVPLGALLRLQQDTTDALAPLSRAETLACMLTCAPFVNVDPHRREQLEGVLLSLLAAGAPPALGLRFSLRGEFWSILDRKK
jgi:hypothetical protein